MEDIALSRYEDFRTKDGVAHRVEICIAEVHCSTVEGDEYTVYANVYRFPNGTVRSYHHRNSEALVAQVALDCYADKVGWRYSGRNSRMPVIDYNKKTRKYRELVPVYN